MAQQILTLFGTLLGVIITGWVAYKIAQIKLESDEKQNALKIKLDLKKELYLEYFEHLSKINGHLIGMINVAENRTNNDVIYSFSSSISKLKLVSDSQIVIKISEIDRTYTLLHTFIMKNVFTYVGTEIDYQAICNQQKKLQMEVDEVNVSIAMLDMNNVSLLQELRDKLKKVNGELILVIDEGLGMLKRIHELRKILMKTTLDKIEKLDSLNKDLILLMRTDIGLDNNKELLEFFANTNGEELKRAIIDLLDSAIPD